MRRKLPFICLFFLMVMVFVVPNLPRKVAWAKNVNDEDNHPNGPPCPHFLVREGDDANTEPDHVPTTPFQSECRLHRDVIGLVEPLKLESGIKLNCQGHKILPAAAGRPDNPATPGFDPVFSQPQLAIFLNNVHGIAIENCVIDGGFDFGILAINSSVPEDVKNDPELLEQYRNKIFNNTIDASYTAIHLMASDDFDVTQNRITYFALGGAGIFVDYGSDVNELKNNTIKADIKTVGALSVPGPVGALANPNCPGGCTSNQVNTAQGSALNVTQNLGPLSTLSNVIIEGRPPVLYQLALPNSPELNDDFTADNIVEENDISVINAVPFSGPGINVSGIAAPSSLRTTIINNKVESPSGVGVRDGQTTVRLFPGKCSLDADRLCLTDGDCFINKIDALSKGTCTEPSPTPQDVDWTSRDLLVEDNIIEGPFMGGISIAAKNAIVRGNAIMGPLIKGGVGGIALRGKFGLESGVVITRNIISNVSTALRLDTTFGLTASFFNAKISLNDFTGYTIAVQTSNDYDFASELSVGGKGNYWGLNNCALGGFDTSKVQKLNGSLNPQVVDSHPFGEPVAEKTEKELLEIEPCF
jgi:hypothetical protein